LVELVLIPGLATFLPWSWCYRIFRLLSRWERLYSGDAIANCASARRFGLVADEADCRRKWRLMAMVDQADFYLAMTRGNDWIARHTDIEGRWPPPGAPALLFGFHWGVGMWTLRHLASTGLRTHALVGPQRRDMYPGRRLRYEYYRVRNVAVRRALGTEPLDITGSLRPILQALRDHDQVLAIVDVPSYLSSSNRVLPFLGRDARFPKGIFRVAVDRAVPVTIFVNGFRFTDGRRFLRLYQLGIADDVEALMTKVYDHLETLVREEPAAWHFWRIADTFFDSGGHP
jgi:lauroyl/myristoyl acyltransferase